MREDKLITIMTPTYNREKLLGRLYNSLLHQSCKDFEWLIIDDGSVDSTGETVSKYITESKINIRYIYQENRGKAAAYNKGIDNANGKYFFCVDSDDYLPNNAIELIAESIDQIGNLGGVLGLKEEIGGRRLGDKLPDVKAVDTFELSEKYNCNGEWSLIYKTSILKNNKFPIIAGEKFVTECVVYDKIADSYKVLLLNKVLTKCEYQDDGLTSNLIDLMLNNPTGYKIYYSQRIDLTKSAKLRAGYILRYSIFNSISKDKEYNYKGKYRFWVDLFKPVGFIGKQYYYRRLR